MPLGNVVLLPGFTGSSLLRRAEFPIPSLTYWPEFPPQLGVKFPFLELAADGFTPQFPLTGQVDVGGVVRLVYDPLIGTLKKDWTVFAVGYDFRLSLQRAGERVLTVINSILPGQDYSIVAHSMGGLVARFVWRQAGLEGTQNRIKRIVTLGAPHWGTYTAVEAFTRRAETYRLLVIGTMPSQLQVWQGGVPPSAQPIFRPIDRVLASWPGLYDQFPNRAGDEALTDPKRSNLLGVSFWENVNVHVSATRLSETTLTQNLLAGSATQPPDSILVCVSGRGLPTIGGMDEDKPRNPLLRYTRVEGDGNVTRRSSRLRDQRFEVFAEHFNLIYHPNVLNNLTPLIQFGLSGVPPPAAPTIQFAIPGPDAEAGPETTQAPTIFSTIDFSEGLRRAAAGDEPRPAYCP